MISEPLIGGSGPVFLGMSGRLHGLQILACIAMALTCQLCCTASKARPDWFYEISLPPDVTGTSINTKDDSTVYSSLWWHNTMFYALLDSISNSQSLPPALSMNCALIGLPTSDARSFINNTRATWVPGVSLLIDYPFAAYPDNFGHWAELLLPIYNVIEERTCSQGHAVASGRIDSLVMTNVRKQSLVGLDWFWEMLKLVLASAVPPGRDLPRVIFSEHLSHLPRDTWLGFEAAVVVHTRYARGDGRSGFASPDLGQRLRRLAFTSHGMQPPEQAQLPRTITVFRAAEGEEVVNSDELMGAMRDIGQTFGMAVRPYTATPRAPFESYLSVMARTGVLVSRHGPFLANSIFLPPGAMVVELLPYNWEWKGVSRIYKNITSSMGDIHHFAWRAKHPKWAVYPSQHEARYAEWTAEECVGSDCLDVHARAAMRVDVATVQELIVESLPGCLRGQDVEELEKPWPELVKSAGSTGLWWDK
ncbi:hypothetical protein CVIRNUC_008078 [Coccomyxa viridis]|uniref:Glycosyltransferase n=1 Tax=Coccomyxa viridis TaxID=1274662 RepID=A0AAV1IG41_9CHLO|nr:hypothetical protein CVIRNUC_008078 [Coccomyxa viridis]